MRSSGLEKDLGKVFKCRSFPLEFTLALKHVMGSYDRVFTFTIPGTYEACVQGIVCECLNKSPL